MTAIGERFGTIGRWSVVVIFFSMSFSRSLFAAAALTMLIGWVLEGQWAEKWLRLKRDPGLWFLLLFVTWIYSTALWSDGLKENVEHALSVHWKLLLIPIVIFLIDSDQWRARCWQAFAVGMIILLVHIHTIHLLPLPWTAESTRDGVFFNPSSQALGLAIFAAWCLHRCLMAPPRSALICLYLFLFGIASHAVLFINQQRLSYLCWGAACTAVLFISLNRDQRKWLVVGALTCCAVLFFGISGVRDRIDTAIQEASAYSFENSYTSTGARLHTYFISTEIIPVSPLVGHGVGSYPSLARQKFNDDRMCEIACGHPHSLYLLYLIEFGLVGLALFLGYMYQSILAAVSGRSNSGFATPILIVFLLSGLIDTTFWYRGFVYLFVPLLAMASQGSRPTVR
jgi:O-antigen ligase